jgi:hypothetical protein
LYASYRQALESRNMGEELQTLFQVVIRFVNYVKNCPLGRFFAKLRDDVEAEHLALLYYCETLWLSPAKMIHRVLEIEEGIAMSLSDSNKTIM